MKLEKIRIDRLNTASYNPRVDLQPGDAVYDNLKKSVETFGFLQPIIVNRRNHTVVGGHQRLKVLQDLGHSQVEVGFVDLSDEHEKALNLTLNKTVGEWDESKLAKLLQEIEGFPEFDLQLTGFGEDEIGDLISRVLDAFSQQTGLSVVIGKEVTGAVTARLLDVEWDQALDAILKPNGFGYQRNGKVILVLPI